MQATTQSMFASTSEKVLISIDSADPVIETGIHGKKLYFNDVYKIAGNAVDSIVLRTRTANIEKARNRGKTPASEHQIQNVISFIGKRGTGKTSAILSFAKMLSEHNEIHSQYLKQNANFICLDHIDGALLEDGEDILKVILARMHLELEALQKGSKGSESFQSNWQELMRKFEELFKKLQRLGSGKQQKYEDAISPMVSLKQLSGSLEVRDALTDLVQMFVRFMSVEKTANINIPCSFFEQDCPNMLVITIDDLDLNINYGYAMLEKLNRYLMIPNVVILLAVDIEQLARLCEKHFYNMIPLSEDKINNSSTIIRNLTLDYLGKVLPQNARAYLPTLSNQENVYIAKSFEQEGRYRNPKEEIFYHIYRKLGMRLDICGSKRHFFEPEPLRAFVAFHQMLQAMDDILLDDRANIAFQSFEQNYREFYSDICIRMANDLLDERDSSIFSQMILEGLAGINRAFRYPYQYIRDYFINAEDKEQSKIGVDAQTGYYGKKIRDLIRCLNANEYSYGEFLRIIYYWGRVYKQDWNSNSLVLNKPIIHCILAYSSLQLVREAVLLQYSSSETTKNTARSNLLEVLNGSFAGSWANRMLPMIYIKDVANTYDIGHRVKVRINSTFRFPLPSEWDAAELGKALVVLSMFFDQPYYKTGKQFTWDFNYITDTQKAAKENTGIETRTASNNESSELLSPFFSGDQTRIILNNEPGIAVFNVFNVVTNAFHAKDAIKLLNSLIQRMESINGKTIGKNRIPKLAKSFDNWYEYSVGFALPFYDVDLCYNLAKRIRQRRFGKETIIPLEALLGEIRDIFLFIFDELEKNDKAYENIGISLRHWDALSEKWEATLASPFISFADAFRYCPYIDWFLELTDENQKAPSKKQQVAQFRQFFETMIINLVAQSNSEVPYREFPLGNSIIGYED